MTPVREALDADVLRSRLPVYVSDRANEIATEIIRDMEGETHDGGRWAIARWVEALSVAPGEPCAVKPLVWRDHRPDSFPEPAWSAQTPFGFYNIEEVCASDSPAYVVRLHAHHFIADKDGLDEAKAAAQADYEQRIKSALVFEGRK